MPISPLAATIATGNPGALMLGADPALAEAQSILPLAQGMMQTGLSTAPAYLPQAVGRLAQALVGAGLYRGTIGDLARATTGSASHAADILEREQPDNPAIGFLRSSDPFHQMLGLQMLEKTAPIQAELKSLAPQNTLTSGSGRNIATGSPAQGAAAAGAEAAAKAPYEGGGEANVQTPTGPQTIPITAATRAVMQPTGGGATPAVAIPPPEPKGANKTPQTAAPAVQGKPVLNPAVQPLVEADAKELSADRESALKGQQDMANVRMIQDFLPKVQTGWSADTKLEGARILKTLGATDDQLKDFLNTDVAAGQILQKKFVELSAAAARTMGAREPGSVIQMFAKAYPNLGTDPQAVRLQTNALYMDRLRQQNLAKQKTNYLIDSADDYRRTGNYRGLKGFNDQFEKSDPSESYLHAAEAMSSAPEAWQNINDPTQAQQIVNLIPSGSTFLTPSGKLKVKP